MATYAFESITAVQALGFMAASDSLAFSNPAASGNRTSVVYSPATTTPAPTVTLTDLTTGRAVVFGATVGGQVSFADGSNVFVGNAGAETFSGTAQGDGLFGGAGDDTLAGGAGRDLLQGNQGDDHLEGGPGADTFFGGQGNDSIVTGAGANFANGNLGDDTLSGLDGSANTLLGGQQNDSLIGGAGADFLNGNLGDDVIAGGGGGDTVFGEAGRDQITIGDGGGAVDGGADNDTITGGGDADTLTGGGGSDLLRGGGGGDLFLFSTGQSGVTPGAPDQILDWTGGADRIHFIGLVGATRTTYLELNAADYGSAKMLADSQVAAGNNYVAVQVGGDVVLFVDSANNNGAADDAVMLVGRTLADIDYANIVS